jgi:glycosyltransferase involved in cell wall biosynthesis
MSHILFISFIPTHPPTAGNSVRIRKQVELLRELGHAVHFAFLSDGRSGDLNAMHRYWGEQLTVFPYCNPAFPPLKFHEQILRSLCWRLRLPFRPGPKLKTSYGIDDWYDDAITPEILKLTERINPSALVVEYVFFSRIFESLPAGILKVMDTHDIFTDRGSRADSQWFSTTRAEESRGLNRAHTVMAIQNGEAEYFRKISTADVVTIGHPIDRVTLPERSASEVINIGYLGSCNMDNVTAVRWFFDRVYPLLRTSRQKMRFALVGGVCNHLNHLPPDVIRIPFAESLDDVYADMDIVINPAQKGTGLKIKTVEALGFGRPLVTTSIGADGLLEQSGKAFELADSPKDFADKLLALAENPARRRELSLSAHDFCRAYNGQIRKAIKNIFD